MENDTNLEQEEHCPQKLIELFFDLRVFALGQNRLRELPDSLCDLISLEELRLSKNHVEALSVHFGRLTSLRDLRFDNNLVMSIWFCAYSSHVNLNLEANLTK